MKKIITLFAAVVFCCRPAMADFKVLGNSTGFEEPESGFCKIISERNGNTAFLHVTIKEGINIRIYDPAHKQLVNKHIEPDYGKLKEADVLGTYEINNNLVLFIRELDESRPVLYRLIIDGEKGNLIEEKLIGTLPKMDWGKGYAVAFGKVPTPDFYVRKDPESDNYAVALFNSFASDRNERIELVHYNKGHQEISRAFYQSPNDEYKYLTFQDMCVMGDKEVIALAVGMNTRSSGGDQNGSLLIGSLAAGSRSLELNKLNYPGAALIDGALIRYNKVTDEFLLLSIRPERSSKDNEYRAYKTVIKRSDYTPVTTALSAVSLNRIANKHFEKKDQFLAIPQNLYINEDGSYTIIFEENLMRVTTYSSMNSSMMRRSVKVFLNDIGIIQYSKDGVEQGAYYIPKSQQVFSLPNMMYYSFREESAISLSWGVQYKSFCYLNGKDKDYVFMNDIEKNQERIDDKKKVVTIQGLNDCEAYSFNLGTEGEMPKRHLLFPDKDSKKDRDIALFTISAYDREHNVFVTLKRERSGRDKSVKLVWLQPE